MKDITVASGRRLTAEYAIVQGTFWVGLCIYLSFAAVYLQGTGYSNSGIGMIVAAGNLLSALLATVLSTMIDRYEWCSAEKLMLPVLAAEAASVAVLALHPAAGVLTSVCFVLYITFGLSVNSLNLKLYIDAEKRGAVIDYGISRSAGSLTFVLMSFLLGILVQRISVRVIPAAGIIICLLQFAAFRLMMSRAPRGSGDVSADHQDTVTLGNFIRNNKRFCVLLLGTVLLFYAHNTLSNFMINVTENVGADTSGMGFLNGFMAVVEIPVMMFYSRFSRGRNTGKLLRLAFVCFGLKGAAIAAAETYGALVAATVLQAPSFALYSAAIVPYVEQTIRYEDSAKAQSLAFTVTTVGSVLAGAISGRLYDNMSVTATLWIAAAAGIAGAVIALAGTAVRTEDRRQ